MKIRKTFFHLFCIGMSAITPLKASAYDNSKFPQFDLQQPHRGFQNISIHPNDEEWLISEVGDKPYLLLYNLRTQKLQHFETPGNYQYTFAAFSPNGEQIVMVRKEKLSGTQMSDRLNEIANSELAIMNKDGSGFQVLPVPRGIIVIAAISPDGKKIAYWLAKKIARPGSKALVFDFDVREFDLQTRSDKLFAGPFHFLEISGINYLSDSTLIVGAFGPSLKPGEAGEYASKYNNSEIYRFQRDQLEIPLPIFSDRYFANNPTVDKEKNIYFVDYPEQFGQSITKISFDGIATSWRVPDLKGFGIYRLVAARSGRYVALIYGGISAKLGKSKFSIAVFQTDQEIWSAVVLPSIETSSPIRVTSER